MAGFKTLLNLIFLVFISAVPVANSLKVLSAITHLTLPAETATLLCNYTDMTGSSLASVTWWRGDKHLITCHSDDTNCINGRYSVIPQEGNCSLRISKVTPDDSGIYNVTVASEEDHCQATAQLNVSLPLDTSDSKYGHDDDKVIVTTPGRNNTANEDVPSRVGICAGIFVFIVMALVIYIISVIYLYQLSQ